MVPWASEPFYRYHGRSASTARWRSLYERSWFFRVSFKEFVY